MFGGVGAEVLYRPLDSNWRLVWMPTTLNSATGVAQKIDEIHRLQRENRISDRVLDAIFAQDVLVKASVGQYLAGDKAARWRSLNALTAAWWLAAMPDHQRFERGVRRRGLHQRRVCSVPLDLFSSGPTRSRAAIG